jgi:hypothetical protein
LKRLWLPLAAAFLWSSGAADASTFTGAEWRGMSPREKLYCVLSAIVALDREGVPLHRSPRQYIAAIDRAVASEREAERQDVAAIFARAVYRGEPASRGALRALTLERRSRDAVATSA